MRKDTTETTVPLKKKKRSRLVRLITGSGRISEVIRFAMVGGLATVIQYGVYVVFVDAVGVPAVPSTMISYAISFICNFFLSSYFTFHSRPNTLRGMGFALSHLVNMGLQVGLVAIFKGIVGPTLALLPAMAICIPTNYCLVRYALTSRRFESFGKLIKPKTHDEASLAEDTEK